MRNHIFAILAVVCLVALAGCSGTGLDQTTAPLGPGTTADPTPSPTSSSSAATPNGTLDVHYIDVGQGSATLVVGPTNETMLIDSGDWRDEGQEVLAFLQAHDVTRIDYLVTSHADADHIGGHAEIIEYYETEADGIGAVYDPGIASSSQTYADYLDAVEAHDVTLYETRAGDSIPFEGVETAVLAPPESYLANDDRNENSLVVQLLFGESQFLLPGDVEAAGEEYLVDEYGGSLNATVLKAGHHGSRSSSSDALLDAVRPQVAVIASGYASQYGHPHEEVLQRLDERSIQTYWTGTHGDVQLTSNGSAVTVATQRAAPTDPLQLRDGSAIEPGVEDDVQYRTTIEVAGAAQTVTSDGGTPTATESATATAADGELSIATIHADAAGDESENLNDEYVVFENTGDAVLDVSGWTVADEADHTYTVPAGVTLDPGAQVTLHTGSGTDTATDLYWGSGSPIWNNAGDTVDVRTDNGTLVLQEDY